MIIGTAGHIDHGKTSLVKALTGVDTDRLKEEKARGITIELGFAYLPTGAGDVLGFVDVPGHERFVHTMLAGAGGIDFALLAIAANDGVKPQTREHLAIIDLLGIGRGLVALTKADLASSDRRAAVTSEIVQMLTGTALEGVEILPVSVLTGEGIPQLRDRLIAASGDVVSRPVESRFRLAVDRSFTLAGAGTVVTGTVLSGRVRVGERVLVSPSGLAARVRSIHAQNRPVEIGRAGERCALNLAGDGISKEAIRRGDVVLDPALHAPSLRIDAALRILPGEPKPVGQSVAVRLHHASAEVGARVVLLGDAAIAPDGHGRVQFVLDRPLAAAAGDRYVIRDVSAQRTVGGGCFIDLRPAARRRRTPERLAQLDALAIAEPAAAFGALLAASYAYDLTAFARDRTLSDETTTGLAADLDLVLLADGNAKIAVSRERWRLFTAGILEQLAAFHAENPDLQGIGRDRLRLQSLPRLAASAFVAALQLLARDRDINLDGAFVRLAAHQVRLTSVDEASWRRVAPLLAGAARFRPPRVRDIAAQLNRTEPEVRRLLKLIGRVGWADQVAHDHFFLRATVREMVGIVAMLSDRASDGQFTAAQFRDCVENGRKVAIQILDFFDRHGVTLRHGDLRRANKHRLDLFGAIELGSEHPGGRETSPVGRPDFKSGWGSETVPGGFDSRSLPPGSARGAS